MKSLSKEDKEIYRERIRRVQRDPGPSWGESVLVDKAVLRRALTKARTLYVAEAGDPGPATECWAEFEALAECLWTICPDCEGTGRQPFAEYQPADDDDWIPACSMCDGEGGWRD